MKEDAELREFRQLMPAPDRWEDAFGLKAMIGGVFVGLIMTPASMYMQLVVGQDIGSAAQWVTIILFIEVARRAFTQLSRPEIYVLYYMAGASLVTGSGLLWNQFIVQSDAFRQFGLADKIPAWVAPSSMDVLGTRSFFHPRWVTPIALMALGMFLQRVDHFGLGYVMYRLTSDVEKLPFPMAPVAAQGVTALADASGGQETWRWRVFSFGAMLGMAFAVVYLALPAITGAFLSEPISVFPLPFKDLTSNTEDLLPAMPVMLSFNLGLMIAGMVLPFSAMVGGFVGLVITIVANPILYKTGVLRTGSRRRRDLDAQRELPRFLPFVWPWTDGRDRGDRRHSRREQRHSKGRGEPCRLASAVPTAARARRLLDLGGSWRVRLLHDGVDPYRVSAPAERARARPGQRRHARADRRTLLLRLRLHADLQLRRGPHGRDRRHDRAGAVRARGHLHPHRLPRRRDLVRTVSRVQLRPADALLPHDRAHRHEDHLDDQERAVHLPDRARDDGNLQPVHLADRAVPSSAFPNAEKMWELWAYRSALIYSSTMPGGEHGPFFEAFQPMIIVIGLLVALALYGGLSWLGLPVLMVYGIIRGLDQATPDVILPQFIGALLGRYYFAKRFGENWPQYRVVFFAGYGCGVGLIMMLSLGVVFLSKSVFQSPY
jgi:hypothetical protein